MANIFQRLFGGKKTECGDTTGDCSKVYNNLQLILDNEASAEEKKFFQEHVDDCAPCLEKYNIEKEILDLIKEKLEKKSCPESIIASIKEKIQSENQA